MGGGIFSIGPFAFGETDANGHAFDLRRYVAPSRSGKYQLQLLYHNEIDLAAEPDMTGLIVAKSQPIDLLIHVPAKNKGLDPGVQALIAILSASAILTLATVIGNRWRRPATESPLSPHPVISRRDITWIGVLLTVALGVWLDDRQWINKIASLTPDANASWSIALDAPEERTGS
jgi:hypothetical protein